MSTLRASALLTVVMAVLLAGTLVPAVAQGPPARTERIADAADPISAALAISGALDSADLILLGRADAFPDNLAVAPFISARRPLLLTDGGPDAALRPSVRAEIDRLLPAGTTDCASAFTRVFVLGGPNALSTAVTDELDAAGHCTFRFAGASRVETSVAVATSASQSFEGNDVIIVRGDEWADAATVGAWASLTGTPVLVTARDALHPAVQAFLSERATPGTAYLLGGEAALSSAVAEAIPDGWTAQRIAGATREGTAIAVADQLWTPAQSRGVMLVNGRVPTGWAYAFAAAGRSASDGLPQLLANEDGSLPAITLEAIRARGPAQVTAVGTTALVSDQALGEAAGGTITTPDDPRFRAVYVVPSDREPVAGREAAISHTASQVSQWFTEQAGMSPRWERDGDDIAVAVVNSAQTAAQLAGDDIDLPALFDAVRAGPEDVIVIWAEAGQNGSGTCGYTSGRAVVQPMDACGIYPDATSAFPFGATYLAAHEMTHAFGAVPACAPNYDGFGHTTDSASDILSGIGRDFEDIRLDPGNDDYFRHGRDDCFDIADSPLWGVPG